ncbi:tRNA(Met) cytidine acetyltransferase TmcA [Zobellella maritima]|uniref:tRNA(Met) cytidine acetyltransferase TmcA n=1 Tax=Zobellella maritima TaxID=2059725 RepID=UPI000E302C19|nr:GNAT family N-acetyltransferase [Zobellella maritima]
MPPGWSAWRHALKLSGERRLLVLAGDRQWAIDTARQLADDQGLWLGEGPEDCHPLPANKVGHYLGREYPSLTFNAYSGLHPDAFGAAFGCLAAGGIALLLCPPFDDWPRFADPDLGRYVALSEQARGLTSHFIRRFCQVLLSDPQVLLWRQQTQPPALPLLTGDPWQLRKDGHGCLNPDQRRALAMLLTTARRRQMMVLTADRGRGKSSLLGLAAHKLAAGGLRLLLTAPNPGAAAKAREHARGALDFIAPDLLLDTLPPADILLIDEAAAIPVPMLTRMTQHYCCIFATTEHGYEGTGLGFQLKFQQRLDSLAPGWRSYRLTTPARWSHRDPLEPLTFRLLALDADPVSPPQQGRLQLRWLDQAQVATDEPLLNQLFGLLTLAHYQTSPSDLRYLLDAPDTEIVLASQDHIPVAAVLIVREGGLDPALGQAVWRGQRRPRGHLLPQSLAFHGGLPEATGMHYGRIMRIVVHPRRHGQGLGSQLLTRLKQHYAGQLDFLGASFGATPELLHFWQHNGFSLVRLGLTADGVSGHHAAMMLTPLSPAGQHHLPGWQAQFQANLGYFLQDVLSGLPADLRSRLPPAMPATTPANDRLIAQGFAFAHRDFSADKPALARFFAGQDALARALTPSQRELLRLALQPGSRLERLAETFGLAGKKAVVSRLRAVFQRLLTDA